MSKKTKPKKTVADLIREEMEKLQEAIRQLEKEKK